MGLAGSDGAEVELTAVHVPDVEGELVAPLGAVRTERALEARRLAALQTQVTGHVPPERVAGAASRAAVRRSYNTETLI